MTDALTDALARLSVFQRDPGFKAPPDAGMSVLGSYGLRNPVAVWLLHYAPEVLGMTPAEVTRGLHAPPCPVPYCWDTMKLRTAEAEGRNPSRLVWRCYHHPEPVQVELKTPEMPKTELTLRQMLEKTRQGALLDFQPNPLTGKPETQVVMPRKKRAKRRQPMDA